MQLPADPQPQPCPKEETHAQPMVGMINMISTGSRLWETDDLESSSKCQQGDDDIIFFKEDLQEVQTPRNDATIIFMTIANYDVKRYLVDNRSSTDILFYDAFSRMQLSTN